MRHRSNVDDQNRIDSIFPGVKFIRIIDGLGDANRICIEVMFSLGLRVCVDAMNGESVDVMPEKLVASIREYRPDSHAEYADAASLTASAMRLMFHGSDKVYSGVGNVKDSWAMAEFRTSIKEIKVDYNDACAIIDEETVSFVHRA